MVSSLLESFKSVLQSELSLGNDFNCAHINSQETMPALPEVDSSITFHYDQHYKGDENEQTNERTLTLDQLNQTFSFESHYDNGQQSKTRVIKGSWEVHIDNPGFATIIDFKAKECNLPQDKGKIFRETVRGSLLNAQTINGDMSIDSMHVVPKSVN